MFQMLVAKLGGLLGRPIYQMPFARDIRPSVEEARMIQEILKECVFYRGILLIQPEHLLSLKLMAIECLLTDQQEVAEELLTTQDFLDNVSIDCVDESDENFSTKFELIYTMGQQESIEFAPGRWLAIQDVVGLLPEYALQVKKESPESIEIQNAADGRFPWIRFLQADAADRVLGLIAAHIVEFGVGIPSRSQSPDTQTGILRYISQANLETNDILAVEESQFWTEATKAPLLLLRGLFAGGVLRFIFGQKRYRVNFGLDRSRTPSTLLAVPYRSKDSPSPRSEFSHPDVVIILTLLSWYYSGLGDEELFDTLTHVIKSDQATVHYDDFVSTASSSLPAAFRNLSGISIRDRTQCTSELFPRLRYSRKAVDYFLAYLVFPKQLRQFPKKLSASGWDLAMRKAHPTTGFSGTNDTRHLLPLSIEQLDLPTQHHTNAQVLSCLLMDETSVEHLPVRVIDGFNDGEHLLSFIQTLEQDVRVLLDCGASILDQNNRQVAETWLKMRGSDVQAVVYFEDEELSVLDRSSLVESLQTSPYSRMLESCIIYLDESHTRGTDLRLPRDYRAALTLGSQVTKDRLTQAAMRMRKLGNGQAVTFIVPEEIRAKIYETTGKQSGVPIEVYDVLAWAIGETWSDLKRSLPLWAVQGQRFESHKHLIYGPDTSKCDAEYFLEDEAASLETRYKPQAQDNDRFSQLNGWDMFNPNIAKIVTRCRDFGATSPGSAALSEEQERELAPEIEEERQVERPPRMKPHSPKVHDDVRQLVETGILVPASDAWEPAFQALCTTRAGALIDLHDMPQDLLVTRDFMNTVDVPSGMSLADLTTDRFQRPVQFVLSVRSATDANTISNLVIISPHEANRLMNRIRLGQKVTLHLFAARSNISFASLDHLMLYTVGRVFSPKSVSVSRSLMMQLKLFAGSLYLDSFEEYGELCDYLGLLQGTAQEGQKVFADGFVDPPTGKWGLKTSPVPFLRAFLMKIRREGEGVEKTHMGRILNGGRLEEGDFERRR